MMEDIVNRKVAEIAAGWIRERGRHLLVKDEQSQDPLQTLETELTDPSPDFHDYFFSRVEEYAAMFNEYTRQYLFILVFAALGRYATEGLVSWSSFRLALTPKGETVFTRAATA